MTWAILTWYLLLLFVFSIQNLFWIIHLYFGQNQDNTHHIRQQVVPHEVTCNPTDDTACDDELSNSFASKCCDSNHHLHSLYNQMILHGILYSSSYRGANVAQLIQTFCPILPPLQTEHIQNCTQNCTHQVNAPMANVNHHLDHQSNHMNPQMHSSTNSSFQKAAKTQPLTQQPRQSCHCSKTQVEKAQAAITRLEKKLLHLIPQSSKIHVQPQKATTMHCHS